MWVVCSALFLRVDCVLWLICALICCLWGWCKTVNYWLGGLWLTLLVACVWLIWDGWALLCWLTICLISWLLSLRYCCWFVVLLWLCLVGCCTLCCFVGLLWFWFGDFDVLVLFGVLLTCKFRCLMCLGFLAGFGVFIFWWMVGFWILCWLGVFCVWFVICLFWFDVWYFG